MRKQFLLVAFILSRLYLNAQTFSEDLKNQMREKVVEATKHAWQGYRQFAWGYDDLQPLTKNGKNWYKNSLLMTPVDAFDTFIFLGMKTESEEAKKLIFSQLNFDVNNEVQLFEITIRLMGGLQSAYELDGDKRFLALAKDLADR